MKKPRFFKPRFFSRGLFRGGPAAGPDFWLGDTHRQIPFGVLFRPQSLRNDRFYKGSTQKRGLILQKKSGALRAPILPTMTFPEPREKRGSGKPREKRRFFENPVF